MASDNGIAGKRVLITGASRGIGRDMALTFAQHGARVVISARSTADLESLCAEVKAAGGQALAVSCDVTDAAQVTALAKQVQDAYGGLDILINNAGAAGSHKFVTHPDELWHQMLAVNLTSVYYVCKAFAAGMLEQRWGRIINIASVASRVGGKYIAAYTAAKHGVLGLTRALAVELAPHVTVNAICPSYVDTPMTDATLTNITGRTGMSTEQALAVLTEGSLQKRLIRPEEVTAMALFLAAPTNGGITGQAIQIDGGMVMA